MKVLLLRANPRKTGYSQKLAELFRQGLDESGAKVVDLDVTSLKITPCDGCYTCWIATPGQCVHHDDMAAVLDQILDAEVIVCVSPVYYYSMSSSLKAMFERMFPLFKPGTEASGQGLTRNRTRYPERWQGKTMITIIVGALKEIELFQPANDTFKTITDGLDLELGGQLTRPESYLMGFALSKPLALRTIEAAFVQAGREAGSTGRLSPGTMAAAQTPLAADIDHFRAYSNVYWERACEMGAEGLSPRVAQQEVGTDERIILREMVRYHDPKATARVRAVLLFHFPDKDRTHTVRIDQGVCSLSESSVDKPDLKITCDTAIWTALFTRQLNLREALRECRIALEGDKSLFTRLERFFPMPSE